MGKQITVSGKGVRLNGKSLNKKATKKSLTQNLTLKLIDFANDNCKKESIKPFWNTYYCQRKLYSSEGKFYGKYCKNRFCLLCNGIRIAEILNKYLPILKEWENPYFLTLTTKSVPINYLKLEMNKLNKKFRIITSKYRKRNQRGNGEKLVGIKSLECNFNQKENTYNPHLHLIVKNEAIADIIINEWLSIMRKDNTSKIAQNKKLIGNSESELICVMKYCCKIFPNYNVDFIDKKIMIESMINILRAMKGLRIFERFGFNLPIYSKIKNDKSRLLYDFNEWIFEIQKKDWVNIDTEQQLQSKIPSTT